MLKILSIKFYKIIFTYFLTISFFQSMYAEQSEIDEYRVEIIIFKFIDEKTDENFIEEIELPNSSVINLVEPRLFLNKDALNNYSNDTSFFSNLLKNISPINNKKEKSKENNTSIPNPKTWYRKDTNFEILNNLSKKIDKTEELLLLGSNAWIQSIDAEEESRYVFLEDIDKEFGIFLRLYKKRFLHIDLKAYLGIADVSINETTKDYIQKYELKNMNFKNKKNNTELNLFLPKELENIEILDNISRKEIQKNISKLNKFINIDQRIFNEEIHLFDHPNFGVIVSVSRI
tara:strand:+ start:880 stop:1746 length:867 start_codon:yes stop_codon:yes gene_type:complete